MAIRSIRSAFTRLGDQIESERYLDRVREQIYFEGGPLLTGGKVGAIDYDHFRGNPDRWNLQQRPSESYHFKTRVFAPPLEFTTQPYNGSLERVIVRAGRETFFQATEIAGLYMFTNKLVIMCNDRAFEVEKWVGVTPDKRQEHPWIEMLRKLEGDRTKEPTMHEIADAEKLYGSLSIIVSTAQPRVPTPPSGVPVSRVAHVPPAQTVEIRPAATPTDTPEMKPLE
jgi:hypothetical protein